MTDTLRNMPRYIRNTDAFGWIWATPRDRDPDWRRSINHENTNRPSGPPPIKFRRSTNR